MTTVVFEIDDEDLLNRRLWQELVYLRVDLTCEICGKRPYGDTSLRPYGRKGIHGSHLDAHHINGDDQDHRLVNGACLCNSCHARKHMADGRKPKPLTPEGREKQRAALTGRKLPQEARDRIADQARKRWADPEFRAQASEAMKGRSDASRAKASKDMSKRWADPDFNKRARKRLSKEEVRNVLRLRGASTCAETASRFGVSLGTIYRIWRDNPETTGVR